MKRLYLLCLLVLPLLFTGCDFQEDEESDDSEVVQGWHFQGRDCLACHNSDLGIDKNLLIAGTLFKNENVTDVDNLNESCGGELVVNFLDTSFAIQVSSKDYEDLDSSGYNAKGNIFILSRMLDTLNGNYYIQIIEKNTNKTLASSGIHNFNGEDYNISNPVNYSNRRSCNACHNGDEQSHLYVQINQDLCK